MHHHNELNVPKELVTESCIAVRLKRLAGNEIEQGIGYRRSNLGQVTYRLTKGIAYGLIESSTPWFIRWDHRGTCGSQHGYPDPVVGY